MAPRRLCALAGRFDQSGVLGKPQPTSVQPCLRVFKPIPMLIKDQNVIVFLFGGFTLTQFASPSVNARSLYRLDLLLGWTGDFADTSIMALPVQAQPHPLAPTDRSGLCSHSAATVCGRSSDSWPNRSLVFL